MRLREDSFLLKSPKRPDLALFHIRVNDSFGQKKPMKEINIHPNAKTDGFLQMGSLLIKYISAPFSNVTGNLMWDIFHRAWGRGSRTRPPWMGMPMLMAWKTAPCRYSSVPGVFIPPHRVLPYLYRQTRKLQTGTLERPS